MSVSLEVFSPSRGDVVKHILTKKIYVILDPCPKQKGNKVRVCDLKAGQLQLNNKLVLLSRLIWLGTMSLED